MSQLRKMSQYDSATLGSITRYGWMTIQCLAICGYTVVTAYMNAAVAYIVDSVDSQNTHALC